MFSNSSNLCEASAGPMGPLAWGTFHVFQETLPYSGQPSLGKEPSSPECGCFCDCLLLFRSLLWPVRPPGFQCVIHRVWVHTALPLRCQKFFPQPWRGALTEGWGPGLRFLHIPAGPDPSVAIRPCPLHPALWVTLEQTSTWPAWVWENFTNIRT